MSYIFNTGLSFYFILKNGQTFCGHFKQSFLDFMKQRLRPTFKKTQKKHEIATHHGPSGGVVEPLHQLYTGGLAAA